MRRTVHEIDFFGVPGEYFALVAVFPQPTLYQVQVVRYGCHWHYYVHEVLNPSDTALCQGKCQSLSAAAKAAFLDICKGDSAFHNLLDFSKGG